MTERNEKSWETLRRIARDLRERRDLSTAMELEAIADAQESAYEDDRAAD